MSTKKFASSRPRKSASNERIILTPNDIERLSGRGDNPTSGCPELTDLPDGWLWKYHEDTGRIYFVSPEKKIRDYKHSTRGELPKG